MFACRSSSVHWVTLKFSRFSFDSFIARLCTQAIHFAHHNVGGATVDVVVSQQRRREENEREEKEEEEEAKNTSSKITLTSTANK